MKKLLSLIIAIAIVITTFAGLSINFTVSAESYYSYYTYTQKNGEATITYVTDDIRGDITIPSSLGGYPVKHIGEQAFYLCTQLTSVTIPDSVTTIGDGAFYKCTNLTKVTMGSGVTSIGLSAFLDCPIRELHITDIAAWCKIEHKNPPLPNPLNIYHNGEKIKNLVIPNGVTSINRYAFYCCTQLTSVTFPNSLTSIGYQAFYNCVNLTSVTFPNKLESISSYAFYGCSRLSSVTFPKSLTSIGYQAFCECGRLSNVTIPVTQNTLTIDHEAFGCYFSVWYTGSSYASKNYLNIDSNNKYLIYSTWHYNTCEGEHTYSSDCDRECNNCEWFLRENVTGTHTYSSDCDKDCNGCGYIRTTISGEHTYSNDCDKDCNNCGEIREPIAEHIYTTVCDEDCDICGEIKEPERDHERAYFCSTVCLTCKKTIEPLRNHYYFSLCYSTYCPNCKETIVPPHNYESDCDTQCNDCSKIREPLATHYYDNDKDMDCNKCGYKKYTPGDLDGVEGISDRDAVYLLYHTFLPGSYPVNQNCDFNKDNEVNDKDAIYLLYHTFLPNSYPIN